MAATQNSPRAMQQRSAETAGRMLEVAIDLLREGGLEACTVQAVAHRAKRAPASVYRRFGDKDGLLKAAIETYLTRAADLNRRSFETAVCANLALGERVETLVRGIVEGRSRDGLVVEAVRKFERNAQDAEFTVRINAIQRETRSLLAGFLAGSANEIGRAGPAHACQIAIDILIGFVEQRMPPGSQVLDDAVRYELEIALLGYLSATHGTGQ